MNRLAAVLAFIASAALASSGPPETALSRLAIKVAQDIERAHPEPPIAVFVRGPSPEMARAFVTLLSPPLSRSHLSVVAVDAPSAESAESAARESGAQSLVRLTLSLDQGNLRARGDLLGTRVNFWSGNAPTRPAQPAAALTQSTEADAQALALAAAAAAPATTSGELKLALASFARLTSRPAAVGAGDLDGDGKDEVLVLTDEEVLVYSPTGALLARREHGTLPSSTAASREPFGAIGVLSKPARIVYLSGRRARGEALALEKGTLRPLGASDDAVLARHRESAVTGRLTPGQNTYQPETTGPFSVPTAFTTVSIHQPSSGAPQALFVFPDGGARWFRGSGAVSATGLGAGSALVDFEGDGKVELATSAPAFAPEQDALRILSEPDASPRWEQRLAKGRVLQVLPADLDGDGRQELILGIWLPDGTGELQVARRVSP